MFKSMVEYLINRIIVNRMNKYRVKITKKLYAAVQRKDDVGVKVWEKELDRVNIFCSVYFFIMEEEGE